MCPIIIRFGLLILCLLILFHIGEVSFIIGDVKLEMIVAIADLIFFFVVLHGNYHSEKKQHKFRCDQLSIDYEQIKKLRIRGNL